jgi:signal peptidase I
MEENLLVGDHILVNKFVYGASPTALERGLLPVRDIQRGDVVVFKYPEDPQRDFIKRCVGLPNDLIEVRNKRLFVNGQEVDDESYIYHVDPRVFESQFYLDSIRRRDNFGPYKVPPGNYFCMGDNRDNSADSRYWGPVPREYVKGLALLIYWSFEVSPDQRLAEGGEGVSGRLRQLASVVTGFPQRTRWSRTFRIVR